jgi:hypothetical protein
VWSNLCFLLAGLEVWYDGNALQALRGFHPTAGFVSQFPRELYDLKQSQPETKITIDMNIDFAENHIRFFGQKDSQ